MREILLGREVRVKSEGMEKDLSGGQKKKYGL